MKKNKLSVLFESYKDVKMTEEEKRETWDGVLRRATDFPSGISPFPSKPNSWDGVLRRKSDFPADAELPKIHTPKDGEEAGN